MSRRTLDALELEGFTLMKARETRVGDEIGFRAPGANYVVEDVETDNMGQVRHRWNDDTATCCYHPGEWLYVKRGGAL